jgi:hypothetical protein
MKMDNVLQDVNLPSSIDRKKFASLITKFYGNTYVGLTQTVAILSADTDVGTAWANLYAHLVFMDQNLGLPAAVVTAGIRAA